MAIAFCVVGAFVGAFAVPFASIVLPVAKRMAAPIVCPAGTERSIVVQRISHTGRGRTSFSSDLYCVDAHRGRKRMDGWQELVGMAAAGAAGGTGLGVVVMLGVLLGRLTRQRRGTSR